MSHQNDISFLDKPEVLRVVFPLVYSSYFLQRAPAVPLPDAVLRSIDVADGVSIGCGFWSLNKACPTILYFHGNGETVADYEFIAPLYTERCINIFVADYRGYGVSTGKPSMSNLLSDCHAIFKEFKSIVAREGYASQLFLMGRSLGSIPAIELAYHYQEQVKGLIVESGTASNLRRLWSYLEVSEKEKTSADRFMSREKIKSITIPTCIIHGESDEIIPLQEGVELYQASGAIDKDMLTVPGAGHNDLMMVGRDCYFEKINGFVTRNSSNT